MVMKNKYKLCEGRIGNDKKIITKLNLLGLFSLNS